MTEKTPIILVFDNIRSMHNVGAIFRTCDGFRIEKILLCGITATPPHRDIRKTALGAETTVDWMYYQTTHAAIETLVGCHIIALEQVKDSVPLREAHIPKNKTIFLVPLQNIFFSSSFCHNNVVKKRKRTL